MSSVQMIWAGVMILVFGVPIGVCATFAAIEMRRQWVEKKLKERRDARLIVAQQRESLSGMLDMMLREDAVEPDRSNFVRRPSTAG